MTKEFDYLTESARTLSGDFHGDLAGYLELREALFAFASAASRLDRIKKLTFYGEDSLKNRLRNHKELDDMDDVVMKLYDKCYHATRTQNILHAALGVASEAGEMVEMLFGAIYSDGELDLVNLSEESGDLKWYLAIIARELGVPWDDDERRNIAKLRVRFPDIFGTYEANNRDLDAERDVLSREQAAD